MMFVFAGPMLASRYLILKNISYYYFYCKYLIIMIFDDGEEVINCARFESLHSSKDDIFSHEQDPEVSRLFTSSPPLHVAAASYNDYSLIKMDTITAGDDDDSTKTKKKDDVGKAAAPGNRLLKLLGNPDSNSSDIFAKCAIPPKPVIPTVEDGQENSAPISALTAMLTDPKKRQKNNVASADSSEVTIYLPDRGEMTLSLKYTNTVQQTIRIILKKHKNEGIRPALQYGQPEQYELRLHEGDGLPDEDFDLEGEKQLIEYGKETEYCLCDAFDDDFEMAKVIDASGAGRETVVPDSIRGSMGIGGARANNVVSVFIHHMAPLNIVVESPTKTLRDLLLTIAKKHRLRLYTDTFEFVVNQDEKERLQVRRAFLF